MAFSIPQDSFFLLRGRPETFERVIALPTGSPKDPLRDWKGEFYNNFNNRDHYIGIEEFVQFRKLFQNRWAMKDSTSIPHTLCSLDSTNKFDQYPQEKMHEENIGNGNEDTDSDDEIDVENSSPSTSVEPEEHFVEHKVFGDTKCAVVARGHEKSYGRNNEYQHVRYVFNPLPIRKKSKKKHVPAEAKDRDYWQQRIKNNIAARKSREDRRRKEIEVVMKCESLLVENCKLKHENSLLQARVKVMEALVHSKMDNKF